MICNICGSGDFLDRRDRGAVQCAGCGSNERARLLWLMLEQNDLLRPGVRMLHIAPERAFAERLSRLLGDGYEPVDIDPAAFPFAPGIRRLDLCEAADLPSARYDVILHSHVMEHVPCNLTAVLFHLHRALNAGGKQICCIPFARSQYSAEELGPLDPQEALERFGQEDHVRRFGGEDVGRTIGMIFQLPETYDLTEKFDSKLLQNHNIPERLWRGWSPNSVLAIAKDELLLRP
jgi:phosphoglycolate phosphatase